MAYQLKTTGIAANCTMCIAVDPDDSTVKDFASSAVTAAMTVGTGVATGTGTWDGNTRHYFQRSGTDGEVTFGATKPRWEFDTAALARTAIWIGEAAGTRPRVFGTSSSSTFEGQDGAIGGATLPSVYGCGWATAKNGGVSALSAGQKAIFGMKGTHGTSGTLFTALHDAASMTMVPVAAPTQTGPFADFEIPYVGRRGDASNTQYDKIHAVLIFNVELTEAQIDTLRDDWFTVLLEPASPTITLTPDPASVQVGSARTFTATRSAPAGAGGVTYNVSSDNPAVATVPTPQALTEADSDLTFDATGVSVGTANITITNAADSNETDTVALTVNALTKKLKLLAHADAQGDSGVAGVVFDAPTGANITGPNKIGEFTGKTFEASLEGGKAVLKVPVADFGGSALTTSDTPVALVRNATNTTGIISCTVIEE